MLGIESGRRDEMNGIDNIKAGLKAERLYTVDERLTVSHLRKPVLSTPMMIDLMERVCLNVIQPFLPPGYTTVGYELQVKHKAAAFLGARVLVEVELLKADGKKLLFDVRASEDGKTIGEGLHRRTIVPVIG
jgi:fluoroacetyl-CoA thioesterase